MLPLNLHVVWSEGYVEDILRGVKIIFFIFLLCFGWDLGHEGLCIG